jgi:phospholipid/cholesterol/gamma-HCH transport system substrate-binding protein
VQYLAPIMKNRQFNFPPLGLNPLTGTAARPNELTFSEDWLRPDYIPPQPPPAADPLPANDPPPAPLAAEAPLPADQAAATNPADGLPGLMVPPGGGG